MMSCRNIRIIKFILALIVVVVILRLWETA